MTVRKQKSGFTFLEVMVTVVVLSVGIIAVYRVFLSTLKYRNHVAYRLCAMNLANAHLADVSEQFRLGKSVSLKIVFQEVISIHNHDVVFAVQSSFSTPGSSDLLKRVETTVGWREGERNYKILRSALISQ